MSKYYAAVVSPLTGRVLKRSTRACKTLQIAHKRSKQLIKVHKLPHAVIKPIPVDEPVKKIKCGTRSIFTTHHF